MERALEQIHGWFREKIVEKHEGNARKLVHNLGAINPMLVRYLSMAAYGDISDTSLAKTIVYPKVLGTSISTIFGSAIPDLCVKLFPTVKRRNGNSNGIEFFDFTDSKYKFAMVKLGPSVLNSGDIGPLREKLNEISRQGELECAVGIVYGESSDLNKSLESFQRVYPVYVGNDFWTRISGSGEFYKKLVTHMEAATQKLVNLDFIREVVDGVAARIRRGEILGS